MKRVTTIFVAGYPTREKLQSAIERQGIDPASGVVREMPRGWMWEGCFDTTDVRWLALKNESERTGLHTLHGDRFEYSNEEILHAELLWLELPNVTAKGDAGPSVGTSYDLSAACELCLSGARALPPFRFAATELPRSRLITETHGGSYLVSGQLASELQEIVGESLVPVSDRKSSRTLPWFLIQPDKTLPRWSERTLGMQREHSLGYPYDSCSKCGRDCHGPILKDAKQFVYRRFEVMRTCGGIPRIAATWERMGPGARIAAGGRPQVAQPYIMVGAEVAAILLKHAKKWIRLSPIVLE